MIRKPFFATMSSVFCLTLFVSSLSHAGLPAGCGKDLGDSPATVGDVVIRDESQLAPLTQSQFNVVKMSDSADAKDRSRGLRDYYLNAEQREGRRFVVIQGKTYTHDGRELISTANKFGDLMEYVMDSAGNMYLFDENTCHQVRHGSMLAGDPVAGAGNIRIEKGEIVYIDSDSGHYPSTSVFKNVLKRLAQDGASPAQHPLFPIKPN